MASVSNSTTSSQSSVKDMISEMSSNFEADFDKEVGITFSLEDSYLFQKNNGERIEVRLVDK